MWKDHDAYSLAESTTDYLNANSETDDSPGQSTHNCYDLMRTERVEASSLFRARDLSYDYWVSCQNGSTLFDEPIRTALRNNR